jgi:hypothetical protein
MIVTGLKKKQKYILSNSSGPVATVLAQYFIFWFLNYNNYHDITSLLRYHNKNYMYKPWEGSIFWPVLPSSATKPQCPTLYKRSGKREGPYYSMKEMWCGTVRFSMKLSRLVLSLDCRSLTSAFPSPLCRGGQNTLSTACVIVSVCVCMCERGVSEVKSDCRYRYCVHLDPTCNKYCDLIGYIDLWLGLLLGSSLFVKLLGIVARI